MAVTASTRFEITRWSASGDPFSRTQMDGDHAKIDLLAAMYSQGLASERPSAGKGGRFYYATDTKIMSYDNGVGWEDVTSAGTVTLTGTQVLTNKTLTAPTITGTIALPSTTSIGTVSDTEIGYLDGVTSSIQTQINTKAPSASPTFSGAVNLSGATITGGGDTATAATRYFIETGSDGVLRTKTLANVKSEIVTTATVNSAAATSLGTVTSGTWNAGVVAGQYGGTGVANTGKTITLGGNLVTSGAYAITLTATNTTSVTLPTSGTLATTSGTVDIEITDATKGIILKSAGGTRYRITVDNDGSLTTTSL